MADAIRSAAEELVTIVLNQCGGYLSGPGFEAAQAARKLREALAQQPEQGEYSAFANPESAVETHTARIQPAQGEAVANDVQRVIDRLMSADPDFDDCEDAANMLRRLSALPPAQSVPDGWKLVPVELNDRMVRVGAAVIDSCGGNARWSDIREAWDAMLNAAPELPR